MPEMHEDAAQRVKAVKAEAAVDLDAFLSSFGGQEIKVAVSRMEPAHFKGRKTKGLIETFDSLDELDEQNIADRFGGGKYQLRVMRRDSKGRMMFAGSTMVDIAGDPVLPHDDGSNEPPGGGNGHGGRIDTAAASLAGRALDTMEKHTREVREEMRQRERAPGFDRDLIKAVQEPVMQQLVAMQRANEQLQQRLDAKEDRLYESVNRPAPPTQDGFTHRILEKMVDGESARVDTLRATHEAELRQMRANHQAEIDRERDRLKEDARVRERQHEREIDMIKQAHQAATDSLKTSFETRIDALKSDVARLQGDLTTAKTELGELRARKDKTLVESAKEIATVRDALKDIAGEDDDEDKGSVFERVVSSVMQNPESIGQLLGGVRGAVAPGPSPEQIAAMQQQQQLELHAAQQQARAKRKRRRHAAAAAQQPTGEATSPPAEDEAPVEQPAPIEMPKIPAEEVRAAVAFMENACQNGTDPTVFAATVRNFVPGELLAFIERLGIDAFLDHVGLSDGSVLRTQRGRNFSRATFAAMLGG